MTKLLKELCSFGIGGPASDFIEVRTVAEMQEQLIKCKSASIPYFILGKGSNCLFSDRGFNGLVIHNKIDFFKETLPGVFHVGSGSSFSHLGVRTARQGWSGLEFACGIPASVGGAVFMNAGASGQETAETLLSVDFINDQGVFLQLPKDAITFSYRTSSFQTMQGAIVGATFALAPSAAARKKQLALIEYRQKTQPYSEKSAGCIFRNPVNKHAGALIELTGLKGFSIGGAEVSRMHANFIINKGQAKAQDVLELVHEIQTQVLQKNGISLESELRIIPY